jgi:hypothetical protein
MESGPMSASELGQFVCVIHPESGCLHSPAVTISWDGVWVKTDDAYSSAHRDCFEAVSAQPAVRWVASGRNGYHAVDRYQAGSSGTFGSPLIFRLRKDADAVARALNEAFAMGVTHGDPGA